VAHAKPTLTDPALGITNTPPKRLAWRPAAHAECWNNPTYFLLDVSSYHDKAAGGTHPVIRTDRLGPTWEGYAR